ncbi:MAG: hypothetical protein J2P57_08230 [Acidimicrobiaceae bacterium]|nr:hypothetical protein [Acidimicrobiaceae bacterium]
MLVRTSSPVDTTRPGASVTIPGDAGTSLRAASPPGRSGPTTTQPGAVITIPPGGTAPTIIGPHNDSSDFWALGFALVGIVVAVVVVRLVFKGRAHPARPPEERRPGAPGDTERRPGAPGDAERGETHETS